MKMKKTYFRLKFAFKVNIAKFLIVCVPNRFPLVVFCFDVFSAFSCYEAYQLQDHSGSAGALANLAKAKTELDEWAKVFLKSFSFVVCFIFHWLTRPICFGQELKALDTEAASSTWKPLFAKGVQKLLAFNSEEDGLVFFSLRRPIATICSLFEATCSSRSLLMDWCQCLLRRKSPLSEQLLSRLAIAVDSRSYVRAAQMFFRCVLLR